MECFMVTLKQIQDKLSEVLSESEYTQTALSEKLGVSQQTISHYKHGDIMPALDTFANLCIVLDIDPADILCTNTKI